jgi:gas vesicle protein
MNSDRVYYSHDAELHAMREKNRLRGLYMMVGLGFGAVLALLFAPKSGEKTRAELTKSMEHSLNTGRDAVEPVVKRVEKEIDDLGKSVGQTLSNGRDDLQKSVEAHMK